MVLFMTGDGVSVRCSACVISAAAGAGRAAGVRGGSQPASADSAAAVPASLRGAAASVGHPAHGLPPVHHVRTRAAAHAARPLSRARRCTWNFACVCKAGVSCCCPSCSGTRGHQFSEGASGAFMCFSKDKRYIVKTASRQDIRTLQRILPAYVDYMRCAVRRVAVYCGVLRRIAACCDGRRFSGNAMLCWLQAPSHITSLQIPHVRGNQALHEPSLRAGACWCGVCTTIAARVSQTTFPCSSVSAVSGHGKHLSRVHGAREVRPEGIVGEQVCRRDTVESLLPLLPRPWRRGRQARLLRAGTDDPARLRSRVEGQRLSTAGALVLLLLLLMRMTSVFPNPWLPCALASTATLCLCSCPCLLLKQLRWSAVFLRTARSCANRVSWIIRCSLACRSR